MKSRLIIGFAVLVLLAAVAVGLRASFEAAAQARYAGLIDRVPTGSGQWTYHDMDMATSPEMKRAVNELLNYDRSVFREYTDGRRKLALYVAHWNPRKFHPRLIAIHTPDVCWVGNGWKMSNENYSYPVSLSAGPAWPAQYREFDANGTLTYVIYWHVVNGRLSGYAVGPNSAQSSFVGNLMNDLRHAAGEQFFIRISSEQPWEEWVNDPLFKGILDAFAPVLLARPD